MRTAICWTECTEERPRVVCGRAAPDTIFIDLPGGAAVQLDDEAAAALYEALGQTLQDRALARHEMTISAIADGEAAILSGPPDHS